MVKKATIFTLAFCLLLPSILLSQVQFKEANNWALFNLSELDFNVGSPPAVSHNTQMNGGDGEGSCTISDKDGNLLFYTDGFDVWDRNHNVMPNGAGLSGGATRTSTNSGVIVPIPGSNTQYYIFVVGPFANPVFEYTLVDMNLNGGMGDVVVAQKNQQLFNFSTEKITATKHANGRDIWVICHEGGTANYRSYLVTPAGINPVPVVTNIGTVHGTASDGVRGAMKVSSKGGKLVACIGGPGRVEIFDFDRATGVLANAMLFNDTDFPLSSPGGSSGTPYGVEFSPDETKLYFAQMGSNTMVQLDVSVWDRDSIINSTVNMRTHYSSIQACGLLQMGPDKKIYVAQYLNRYLGVINDPNQTAVGNACGFDHQGVDLGSGYNAKYGLPVFIQSYFDDPSITFDGTCPGDTTNFYYAQGSFVDSILWDFDDPASGPNNYATTDTAQHFYSTEGTYNVQLIIYNGGINDTLFATVEITYPPVTINNGNDTIFCGTSLDLTANNVDAVSYLWSTGDTTKTITVNSTGTYYVTITNHENCQNSDTIDVQVNPALTFTLTGSDAGCSDDGSISTTITGGTPTYSYLWSDGQTTPTAVNLAGGSYYVTVTDGAGCVERDTTIIAQPIVVTIDSFTVTDATTCGGNDGAIDISVSGGGSLSPQVIAAEGFETDGEGSRYTLSSSGHNSTHYFFKRGDDGSISFNPDPTNEEGSYYFAARWGGFGGVPADLSLTLAPQTITGYTNIEICALLALGYTSGYAGANHITIEYNVDGGGWNTLKAFEPNPSGVLAEDNNNDGIGDGIALASDFQDFCYSVPVTGNSIEVRISLNASGSSLRQIAFDNIRVRGVLPLTYSYLWSTGDTTEDVSSLIAGTYDVTVTGENGCTATETFSITDPCTIIPLVASFTPSDTSICVGDCITFTDNSTGTNVNAWNWSFPSGTPTSATGQNPGSICYNSPGTFNMTLQVTDDNGTDDTTMTVTVTAAEDATFNYSAATYCQNEVDPTPTISGTGGGTFTSTPVGLSLTAGTGVIDLSASTPGTYGVLYTTPNASCGDTLTVFVTVTATEDAMFNYSASNYCQNEVDPTPTISGTAGGTFTSTPVGLSLTAGTGVIDLSASTPGTYGVLYTTPSASCQDTLTVFVTIDATEDATFNYSTSSYCQTEPDPTPTITGTSGGTFTSTPAGLSLTAGTGVIDLSASTPGTYGVLYTTPSGSCPDTLTVFVTVTSFEDATFNYSASSYCQNEVDPTPTISGTSGGTFTSTPAGLSLTAGTGVIDLSASTPGTYGVLYTTPSASCQDTLTVFVTIEALDDATFNYSATSYCQTGLDPTPTITGTSGGTFTSTPAGLSLTAGTGAIDLSASTPGTYGVLYTTPSVNCPDTLTVFVTIETTDDATFNYSAATYCQNDVDPAPTITGTAGGMFTSTPVGLSLTAGTGVIDLSASTPGTYGVLYTTPSVNCPDTLTVFVTVDANDDATFSYSASNYCQNEVDPTPTITGTSGGTFTSTPAGLSLTAGTGVIDLSASTPGTYGVLYTTPSVNCPDTLTVFVTIEAMEDATFSYTSSNYCQNGVDPTPTITGKSGGTFTSTPAGLSLIAGTGAIDLSASTPGTYGVLYTTPSVNCPDTLTIFVTIEATDDATFSYTTNVYCLNDANPTPTITGLNGGVFTIDNGGVINSVTGELDVSGTGGGLYTVTYTTTGTCPATSSVSITITDQSDATITPVGPYCENDLSVTLSVVDGGGTWSGTGVTAGVFSPSVAGAGTHEIIYSVGTGNCADSDTIDIIVSSNPILTLIAKNDSCFNEEGSVNTIVTGGTAPFDYNWDSGESTANISELPAGTYTLVVTDSVGCTATSFATIEDILLNCDFHIFLPNIFSPNGDGSNDVFFVRGKGIKSLSMVIYSRWGEKVFETSDKDEGWDGRFRGQDMNAAVFVYYVRAVMVTDEVIEQKGNVTLVR
ncbi:MAG: gliding motility-associated C-terminal domain-containing protein [Vicingus serpentipes]|nr:gliding motility-associated C-terminal domain-containing protein [Vicingus serpentipes]